MIDEDRAAKPGAAPRGGVRLPPVGSRISVESARMSGRLWTTLVGFRTDRYILIETPEAEIPAGMNAPFSNEDMLTMRYIAEGIVFGWRAPVIGRVRAPVALTVVAYPRQTQIHALRRHPRISCNLPCRGRIGEHRVPQAMLRDASDFGCQVRVARKDLPADMAELPVDVIVELEVEIPSESGAEGIVEQIRGHAVAIESHENYLAIRVQSQARLDGLMRFLSSFTTRLSFDGV